MTAPGWSCRSPSTATTGAARSPAATSTAGAAVPGLAGTYLYADYCAGTIWGLEAAVRSPAPRVLLESGLSVASFGEDEAGELYVVDLAGGRLFRIVEAAP